MLQAFKTEINPTPEQKQIINKTSDGTHKENINKTAKIKKAVNRRLHLSNKFIALSCISHIFIFGSIIAYYHNFNSIPPIILIIFACIGNGISLYKNVNIVEIMFKKTYTLVDPLFSVMSITYYHFIYKTITDIYMLNFADILYVIILFAYIYRYYKLIEDGKINFN